jgi:hypothetical protein
MVNVTDRDSRVVQSRRGFLQGYTAQAVATADQIVITAEESHEVAPLAKRSDSRESASDRLEGWRRTLGAGGARRAGPVFCRRLEA